MSATTGYPVYAAPYYPVTRPLVAPYANGFYPNASCPWHTPTCPVYYPAVRPNPKPALAFTAKPEPSATDRLTSLAKAAAFMAPALLLAKYAPSQARHELLPSDWKVWAKMLLGMASLNQVNKAIHWQPPPWLNAMMSVAVMTPLISGFKKTSLKPLLVLAPTVAALVQSTHWLGDKTEKPFQENFNIPPLATRLALSVASMGVGLYALPGVFKLTNTLGLTSQQESAAAASTTILQTCSRGCCSGSAICLNELFNAGSALGNSVYHAVTGQPATSARKTGS